MKKLFIVLAVASLGFVACNNETAAEAKTDSLVSTVDSMATAAKDSVVATADSAAKVIDSTAKAVVDSIKK
jgi:hypothetical protein